MGVLIDRRGHITTVVVGDAKSVFLPDLSAYRRDRDRLTGLRLVHTHLKGEALNDDDLTDLALLRLDLVAAVEVLEDGLPGRVYAAHLLPDNEGGLPWEIHPAVWIHDLPDDFPSMIDALDEEFRRLRRPREAGDDRDRAILVHVASDHTVDPED